MDMMKRRPTKPTPLLLAAALLCSMSLAASAKDGDSGADSYSRDYKVSIVEAKKRLAREMDIGRLDNQLQRELPDVFAGLYIEHTPKYRVVVKFTEHAHANLARYTTDPIFVAETAPRSLEFLRSAYDELTEQLAKSNIQFESGLDLTESVINLSVRDPGIVASRLAGFKSAANFIRLYKVEGFIEPTAEIVGGGELRSTQNRCTTGFNVVNSAKELGVLTAGHCDEVQSYLSGTTSIPLTFQSEQNKGSYDLQWHKQSSTGLRRTQSNVIRTPGGPAATMSITSTRASSDYSVGAAVCKNGIATNYTCGVVADMVARADWMGEIGTYIRVHNVNNKVMTAVGDSGGPVFMDNAAYGIVHGRGATGSPTRNDLYFMPIERLDKLGLTVVTEAFALSGIPNVSGVQGVNIPANIFFTGHTHFPVKRKTRIISCANGWDCADYNGTYTTAAASPLTFNFLCYNPDSMPTATFRWSTTLEGADGVVSNAIEHTSTCTTKPGVTSAPNSAKGRPKITITP